LKEDDDAKGLWFHFERQVGKVYSTVKYSEVPKAFNSIKFLFILLGQNIDIGYVF
jgi:hypothetical protein